jgi:hypothetical protein
MWWILTPISPLFVPLFFLFEKLLKLLEHDIGSLLKIAAEYSKRVAQYVALDEEFLELLPRLYTLRIQQLIRSQKSSLFITKSVFFSFNSNTFIIIHFLNYYSIQRSVAKTNVFVLLSVVSRYRSFTSFLFPFLLFWYYALFHFLSLISTHFLMMALIMFWWHCTGNTFGSRNSSASRTKSKKFDFSG